jgi:alkylation response protein AidB-like acyl-CoA dehydrogenase
MITSDKVLADVARLLPDVRAAADEIERGGRLPRSIVDGMVTAGVFKLGVPRELGGFEADVATLFTVLETIASADGSAGWCAMIGATSGLVSGYLDAADAQAIFGAPDVIAGGVFAPYGRAVRDGDDVVVSGRWPFASGSSHCTWLMGGAMVETSNAARGIGAASPRMVLFPARDATIHETWQVSGLCGTASNDIEVRELRVPYARTVSLIEDRPRCDGALYRFPAFGLLALGIAAVALGIVRGATEEFRELAPAKTPSGSRRLLRERPTVQADVARTIAETDSARCYLVDAAAHCTREAEAGEISLDSRARLRLAATNATRQAAQAVDRLYEAGGGTSIYRSSALQRRFRDVHVATQHAMVAPATYELVGRLLLGVETDASQL